MSYMQRKSRSLRLIRWAGGALAAVTLVALTGCDEGDFGRYGGFFGGGFGGGDDTAGTVFAIALAVADLVVLIINAFD